MAHYVCNHCGAVFDENDAATETFRHDEVRPTYTENFLVCPSCLSSDYDDAAYCYKCHEPYRYEHLKGGYYCVNCLNEMTSTRLERRYIRENLDDYAEWLHEIRAKNHTDEQDAIDTMRGAKL